MWRQAVNMDNVDYKSIEVLEGLNRTTLGIIGTAGFGNKFTAKSRSATSGRLPGSLCVHTSSLVLSWATYFHEFCEIYSYEDKPRYHKV